MKKQKPSQSLTEERAKELQKQIEHDQKKSKKNNPLYIGLSFEETMRKMKLSK